MIYDKILQEIKDELNRASALHGSFNSEFEGFAVFLEEVEELWDEIKKKRQNRSLEKMRAEAIQIAAMAARFLIDICGWDKDDIISYVRDSLKGDRAKIFTHHDGYGQLKIKIERFWSSIKYGEIPKHVSPALSIISFITGFIYDTMQDNYEEKGPAILEEVDETCEQYERIKDSCKKL